MEKKEAKLELIKIFSDTKYEYAFIDNVFIENYIKIMWSNTFESCKTAVKSGKKDIFIDDFTVSSYSGKFPPHERSNVYERMLPLIQKELSDSGIPYESELYTFNKITRFKLNIDELKKFSNFETLEILK